MIATAFFDDSDDLSRLQTDLTKETFSIGYLNREQVDILSQKLQIVRRAIDQVRANLLNVIYEHPYWKLKNTPQFEAIVKLSDCEDSKLDYLVGLADKIESEIHKLRHTTICDALGGSKFSYIATTPKPYRKQGVTPLELYTHPKKRHYGIIN